MTQYVATVNVPGYMPMSDELAVFDTPGEAWAHLAEEREHGEDSAEERKSDGKTLAELRHRARMTGVEPRAALATGTVYGPTPGYDGNHDLGLAYSVDVYVPDTEAED